MSGIADIAHDFGINPLGRVARVVAFAFGLAAASFFPAIIMGIFSRRMNREGAVSGMLLNFATALLVSRYTPKPPRSVVEMVERIRIPRGAGKAHEIPV
jgi:cation/acetate symporter